LRRPVWTRALVLVHQEGEGDLGEVDGRLVVTFNEVGLAAAVAGLGLISMTVGAARKGISEGPLVRALADWDMGEVELHAVFPARKAAKPSARALVDLLSSSTAMIFPSGSQLRSKSPRDQRAWRLLTRVCAVASKVGQIAPNCC
jgi:DNA-binding transcriptional LysR family regulator